MEDGKEQPTVSKPYFKYNTNVDEDIRINKQYFGLSNLTGIDEDILRYKGVEAYNGLPNGLSPCFHLDSRILSTAELERIKISDPNFIQTVTVDGVDGYDWVTVGKSNVTEFGIEPRIGTEEDMINTIYEDKRYRKFTIAFYGGWDGWDYYRTQRSTGDEFTYNKYRGNIDRTSGEGVSFSVINNNEEYDFDVDTKALTSDYYAYLAGVRTLANPKTIDLNVLATPGIDYVNNKLLVNEVISIVEDERADCVYVVTTPDKPNGAGDSVSEMYTPDDVVVNLEDSDIDSNYTCTFYPWVKYYDSDNSQYVYLPVTRDVVRNFAYTDNTTYPWFTASGWNRGTINGIRPRKTLKLSDQDTLYGGRINFVNSFPDEGLKIWGDKNLQIHESQMNRISKRRLLVRIRKLLAIACIGLLFDPNDNTTKKAFESAVEPILRDIQTKRGLIDFRIVVDDSQEARDRLELPAKIYLKLQPNLEYINISMIVTPSGVSFDDI
ncbi:MAG: phage tail sheath subtilisin-like domain-containing protein, partial [Bacilli bacterium]|nr:phage tail sheath subtilisin-like domain-containing protein [Bacilli bacterium]